MRLRRIEAVRFGRLTDVSLGDMGDGLTIVEGPNEAGKSTFTALVRHVLYGFPTAREKERQYHSQAGKRHGRLVFQEGGSRWVVERTEGPHGGPLEVRSLDGVARPALRDELCAGVSPLAFKVVFGFGLDEMAHIESLRGSNDDIIARLYAASAGLTVSPHDVRIELGKEAEELFTTRGKTKRANVLLGDVRETRLALRALEGEAASFVADHARLADLDESLAQARARRDDRRAAHTEVARASERLAERIGRIDMLEQELVGSRVEQKAVAEAREKSMPDERALAVMAEIEVLVDEASAHTQGRTDLRDAEAGLAQAVRRFEDAVARTGRSAEEMLSIDASAEAQRAVDAARDDLQRLDHELETRRRDVERAEMAAAEASKLAAAACRNGGIESAGEPRESLAERYGALEALESGRPAVGRVGAFDAPALVLLGSGVVAVAAGLSLHEYVAVAIGFVLTVAGVFFVLRQRSSVGRVQDAPAAALETLGLTIPPTGMELARIRRLLDACRTALAGEDDARKAVAEAVREADLTRSTLEARKTIWDRWLESNGLQPGSAPADASQVLGFVREALTLRAAVDDARESVERLRSRLDGYARRLAGVLALFTEVAAEPDEDDVPLLVGRARQVIAETRQKSAAHEEAERLLAELDGRVAIAEQKASHASEEATAILQKWGIADGESLEAIAERQRLELEEAERAHDVLADERSRLDERLAERTHEARGGELRLELAGLTQRLQESAEEYAVLRVAARLVEVTQARYERERQPDVVRRAQEVFRQITGDRYVGLTVPIAGGSVEVFDARSEAKTSEELSRGTAEQMYLALRLGLIGQLDDVGRGLPVLMDDVLVNFDPERRRGSAEAIAELADHRQVVLFTCHPEIAELFASVRPDVTRITLDRC
ncbi:MAG: AAA family ATPase [Coriobacteriia bacterium]|nr:AAA family ATPase [Coriobacteriia bacterium]